MVDERVSDEVYGGKWNDKERVNDIRYIYHQREVQSDWMSFSLLLLLLGGNCAVN